MSPLSVCLFTFQEWQRISSTRVFAYIPRGVIVGENSMMESFEEAASELVFK
jgi:hypothetical protein